MNNSFFSKNGTMNQMMNVANDISGMKSDSAVQRGGALARLVSLVMSFLE